MVVRYTFHLEEGKLGGEWGGQRDNQARYDVLAYIYIYISC